MKRREFMALLGGAAAAWPLAARAQQPERMRRIGVFINPVADDPVTQARLAAFVEGLQQLGWTDGRNLRIDTRWSAGNPDDTRKYAAELVALAPDVILVNGSAAAGPLLQVTRTVPIVFVNVVDPVGAGFVKSLSRPDGNATGFIAFEYGLSGKWLELLKEIAPGVTRAAVIRGSPNLGDRPVRCNPGRGTVIRGGGKSSRPTRRWRDRTRDHCLRALRDWRPDRDRELVGGDSSQPDRLAGGLAQTARGLLGSHARHTRRPARLWS